MKINSYNKAFLILMYFLTYSGFDYFLFGQCNYKNNSFRAGEKLYYNVYYNLGLIKIKLAESKLWIDEGYYNNKDVLILYNTTKTVKDFEWIIKVNDYYASYIDKNNMHVERHIQKTLVDAYSTNYEYKFDQDEKKLYVSIENSKTKKFLDTLVMKPCLHDLLSAAFYPRNIDYAKLKVGNKTNLPVILDTTSYTIYFKYIGNENIKTVNNKNVNSIKISPLLVQTSIFKAGENMTVWFSNDHNKIPLRMESELWIGKILVELVKYEGLLHPMSY